MGAPELAPLEIRPQEGPQLSFLSSIADVAQATRFARETGCSWLSVAVGNIHGAISKALKDAAKPQARKVKSNYDADSCTKHASRAKNSRSITCCA